MSVTCDWINPEEDIMEIDYLGGWTWTEALLTNQRLTEMIAAKPYRCDVIGYMRVGAVQTIRPASDSIRKILGMMPDNIGLIVVVTNPLISVLVSVARSINPKLGNKLRTVSTIDEARDMIVSDRAARRSAS